MKIKNLNSLRVRDLLISLADKLPKNLMADAINEHGKFSIEFLLKLTNEQLEHLNSECSKFKKDLVFLDFAQKPNGATYTPTEVKDYSNFNWNNVIDIIINGDTCPTIRSHLTEPIYYVSIVFIMKDD